MLIISLSARRCFRPLLFRLLLVLWIGISCCLANAFVSPLASIGSRRTSDSHHHHVVVAALDPSCSSSSTPLSRFYDSSRSSSAEKKRQQQRRAISARLWMANSTPDTNNNLAPASSEEENATTTTPNDDKNRVYVQGLLDNLQAVLDKWIITGNPATKQRAYNVLEEIARLSLDPELVQQATRMAQRAGLPAKEQPPQQASSSSSSKSSSSSSMSSTRLSSPPPPPDNNNNPSSLVTSLGNGAATSAETRQEEAQRRQEWEAFRNRNSGNGGSGGTSSIGGNVRSALGERSASNSKPDLLLGEVVQDKVQLQSELDGSSSSETASTANSSLDPAAAKAACRVSELVAQAGAGTAFDPETTGIGGLDDVLAQVKRRVWIPLAAPPQLLQELGINPVRGLLLYGRPGCGKTLLARTLGRILSPLRPITIVSGPQVLDKFVGSSEKNVRELFDNPPDIYDSFRIGQIDNGQAIAKAALHVIVLDEFDAIARTRGGRGGSGDQGDAGVARDSVVNQLLAKLDGVDPLVVPTLVIGLTNKRSLIEPALLRPGRFEVQIEVPPPRSMEQRISILRVHTSRMQLAGRLLVRDAPDGTAAAEQVATYDDNDDLMSYEELLQSLAERCKGFSGATLAGVARAAASHALERAVEDFSQHAQDQSLLQSCIVTSEDFDCALEDVLESMGDSDWAEEEEGEAEEGDDAAPKDESGD